MINPHGPSKSFNGRLALILIVAVGVMAAGIHLLHGVQVSRTAVALRDRAEKAEREGRLDRAEDYLGRYLAYRPADVDGLLHYGEILEKQADTAEARQKVIAILEKAVRLAPDRPEIRRRLVALEVADEQFTEAKVHAEVLVAADPRDAGLAVWLGRCEEGTGHPREAAALYDRGREPLSPRGSRPSCGWRTSCGGASTTPLAPTR